MKIKPLIIWLLLVALLLPTLAFAGATAVSDSSDTVYVRKHVSLVYDNSGSMSEELDNAKNLKWAYASYAAQIFAGLLNDTDSLTLTLMNSNKNTKTLEVDLAEDRQKQVDKLRDITNYAKHGTPFSSVQDAEQVLVKKGLLADSQIGDNEVNRSEQFWLVLTTDGQFENGTKTKEELENDLEATLKKYSNLQVVYFGIGTEGDQSNLAAIDLRDSRLTDYPNFTAVYSQKQEDIVSTMQKLANRISGRYSVTKGVQFNGNEVTLRISGETSPIRNIAILAQQTDTKLLSAIDEDGNAMTVNRPANEQYPYNSAYDNIPAGTKGAHTALITCPEGKFQPGTVKLTFSEPVDPDQFSLMYEPAVYIRLTVQQKDASGNWVEIPYGQKVQSGRPLRVGYEICEDGTNTPVDAAKLPGVTTDHITCGDTTISRNGEFQAPSGNTNITATVSLMDGAYTVSTVRSLQVISVEDYTFKVSDPLSFYPDELATNSAQYIDFQIFYQGSPATADQTTDFSVDAGSLQGKLTTHQGGIYRFTPQQENCAPGEFRIDLCFLGQSVASQTVAVKELQISYAAKAGDNLTLLSNQVAANTKPIEFTITRTRGIDTTPLPEEEAGDFRIEAINQAGHILQGVTTFENGKMRFVTSASDAQVGTYTVTLYRQDEAMASASITILQYNAQFTAEVFRVNEHKIDWLDLRNNESALAFVIYADGEACTGIQLEGMMGTMLQLQHDGPEDIIKLDVSIGTYDGKAALLVRPTSTAKTAFGAAVQKLGIAWNLFTGALDEGSLSVELTVQAEKGTQITGALDTFYDQSEYLQLLLWLAGIIVAAFLLALIILANIATPKMFAGEIVMYTCSVEKGRAKVEEDTPVAVRYRPRLKFLWTPEVHENICGLKLVAEDRNYFRRSRPICVFSADEDISKYRYQYAPDEVQTATKIIEEHAGQYFSWNAVARYLRGSKLDDAEHSATECRLHIDDGSLLKFEDEDGGQIQMWVYYRGKKSRNDNENTF